MARGPPCEITGLIASTSGVEAIVPKTPLRTLVDCSPPKLTRFRTLKISHRNCRLTRLLMRVFLSSERSHWDRPGRRAELRPQVPSRPGAGSPNAWDAFVI